MRTLAQWYKMGVMVAAERPAHHPRRIIDWESCRDETNFQNRHDLGTT